MANIKWILFATLAVVASVCHAFVVKQPSLAHPTVYTCEPCPQTKLGGSKAELQRDLESITKLVLIWDIKNAYYKLKEEMEITPPVYNMTVSCECSFAHAEDTLNMTELTSRQLISNTLVLVQDIVTLNLNHRLKYTPGKLKDLLCLTDAIEKLEPSPQVNECKFKSFLSRQCRRDSPQCDWKMTVSFLRSAFKLLCLSTGRDDKSCVLH